MANRRPQLVFISTDLGDMRGFDIADRLSRTYPGLYIAMLSPRNTPDEIRRAMKSGARECLTQPLAEDAVLRVIGEALELNGTPEAEVRAPVLAVMSSKGGVGIRLDMNKVPCREEGMTPYEMMLSESQERMLMVLKPGREAEAEAIFRKWELDFAVIGTVTDTGHMVLEFNGEVVCDIPLGPLADEAPLYERPYAAPKAPEPLADIPESSDIAADLLKLMASPNLASRRWVWEQYDQSVGADTVQRPGGDAAVVRVHGSRKALAITTDCTPRYCYADPYEGGKQAVAEAYRNLCAVGAKPLAVTNCLNFGNPQRPEIMAQFVGALEGMGEACRALDFPIVSGNVSLYNESKATGGGSAILPTPAIGGVGLLDEWEKSATIGFKSAGETLVLP